MSNGGAMRSWMHVMTVAMMARLVILPYNHADPSSTIIAKRSNTCEARPLVRVR